MDRFITGHGLRGDFIATPILRLLPFGGIPASISSLVFRPQPPTLPGRFAARLSPSDDGVRSTRRRGRLGGELAVRSWNGPVRLLRPAGARLAAARAAAPLAWSGLKEAQHQEPADDARGKRACHQRQAALDEVAHRHPEPPEQQRQQEEPAPRVSRALAAMNTGKLNPAAPDAIVTIL